MANLFLPPNFHKDAPVILINGECWQYKQPSGQTPETEEVDGIYQTCEECLASPQASPQASPSPSPTPSSSPTPSPSPDPPVDCNNCDPEMPYEITVRLAGLGGSFAFANGDTVMQNIAGTCSWQSNGGVFPYVTLQTVAGSKYWQLSVRNVSLGLCEIVFDQTVAGECDIPSGSMAFFQCLDVLCAGSCAASSGATCQIL